MRPVGWILGLYMHEGRLIIFLFVDLKNEFMKFAGRTLNIFLRFERVSSLDPLIYNCL